MVNIPGNQPQIAHVGVEKGNLVFASEILRMINPPLVTSTWHEWN